MLLAAIAGPSGGGKLFDALAVVAVDTQDAELRAATIDALGELGPDQFERALALQSSGKLAAALAWPAVRGYLDRPSTRATAWTALAPHLPELLATIAPTDAEDAIRAAVTLCEPGLRTSVASMFEPHVADIPEGRRALDHSLSVIDRCISRRSRAGEFANALRK